MDLTIKEDRKPDETRAPLVSGHRTHDELVERGRIQHDVSSYGRGIPRFPQAMIYVLFLAALVIVLLLLLWPKQ